MKDNLSVFYKMSQIYLLVL